MMTAGVLIELLRSLPRDLPILVEGAGGALESALPTHVYFVPVEHADLESATLGKVGGGRIVRAAGPEPDARPALLLSRDSAAASTSDW